MRILVADDEILLIEYLKRSLSKYGYQIDSVNDGSSALKQIINNKYNLIILDIVMPGVDGLKICREIRSKNIITPVIILSSLNMEETRIKALNIGADDFLIKPFSLEELEARIRALLRRPPSIYSDVFNVNGLIIDASRRTVTQNGREIILTNKEFKLLEYLARNNNRVISKDEILKNIWGIQAENTSNRVDACVKQIRRKINYNSIETIYKSGYRIAQ